METSFHDEPSISAVDWSNLYQKKPNQKNQSLPKTWKNDLGIEFVLIPADTFLMGASTREPRGGQNEKPEHWVTISRSFYLGKFEVTQAQWKAIMDNTNPSHFPGDDQRPVDYVSWEEAQQFIEKLNEREQYNGWVYRLPTEAEWEYAGRAGSDRAYHFGSNPEDLGRYAWYEQNGLSTTHAVGEKEPNAWGLYDMHGNVWEWVQDWFKKDYYTNSPICDPQGPDEQIEHVLRGGSYLNDDHSARSARRHSGLPTQKHKSHGFRLARVQSDQK